MNKIGGAIYWVDNPSGTIGYFAHIVPFVFGRIFFSNELMIRKFSLKSYRHSGSAKWVKSGLITFGGPRPENFPPESECPCYSMTLAMLGVVGKVSC